MDKEHFFGEFTLTLQSLPQFLLWNKEKMQKASFSEMDLFEMEVALEEAFVNIINYSGLPQTAYLKEELHISNQSLCIILEDQGKEFNPLNHVPTIDVKESINDRKVGGLGIFLIHEIMDQINYERVKGSNILTLIKYVKSL